MNKKLTILCIAALLALTGCKKNKTDITDPAALEAEEAQPVLIQVNVEGDGGQIASAQEGEEPEFNDRHPMQSIALNIDKDETAVLAAKEDEGYKFIAWKKDGEKYAQSPQITITALEDAEYVAVFGPTGSEEKHVDLNSVTTLGELFGLPERGFSMDDNRYVLAFEQDGYVYRAVAELPEGTASLIDELDWHDEEIEEKREALLSTLPVSKIENLTAHIPEQNELDALVGKTGKEPKYVPIKNSKKQLSRSESCLFQWPINS